MELGNGWNQWVLMLLIITGLTIQFVDNGWMDSININHYDVLWCINKRRIMKLTNKQKRSVKRRVQLEQGVSTPGTRVFVSKKYIVEN